MAEDQEAPRKREGRPHIIPPAPGWRVDAKGRPEGWPVLDDVEGALGLTLWRALRGVWTWVDTPPERRGGLSQEPTREVRERSAFAAAEAPELADAFGTFALLARAANVLDGTQVAEACYAVHTWAEVRGLTQTAVHFAEAAARADEEDASRANLAGRMCRRAALNDRSSAWFVRAFRLAVRAGRRREALRALLGYGALLKKLGQYAEARKIFAKAARRALRHGRRRQAAEAHHDLLTIEAEVGTLTSAVAHAFRALHLYPRQHAYLPALAHELGYLLVRLGHYSTAIPLLEMATPRAPRPAVAALEWSSLAWAAAGAGRRFRYDEAERRALQLVSLHDEFAPAVMLHLSEGARRLRDWERAERYAFHAAEAARSMDDIVLAEEASDLLKVIEERTSSAPDTIPPEIERIENFTSRLAARLRSWKAPGVYRAGAE
jgi:tetratricopeptide (TPR) repeat protein